MFAFADEYHQHEHQLWISGYAHVCWLEVTVNPLHVTLPSPNMAWALKNKRRTVNKQCL